ncbi:MAG: hypothetical protein H7Z13_04780 [Ferruginibacter sp.]|nr:hypothetical protein [Ferruginibacter sp.]
MNTKSIIATLFCCLTGFSVFAQRDSTKKQTIDITSSYKPVLRNAVKVNFSASNLPSDTAKIVGPYTIPPQNLFYTYQPVSLKPLALAQDSALETGTRNYLKVGFGNFSTPYASAGFSFGDGKTALVNLYADYISSKGNIKNQDYSQLNIKGSGSYFTDRNEVYGSVGLNQQDYHLYGYDHFQHNYNKSQVLQRFQDISIKGGIRNKDKNETGINYNPNVQVSIFSNQDKLTESSLVVEAPVEKTFGDVFSIRVSAKADITSYTSKNLAANVKLNNNIFQLSPELIYAKEFITIHGGVSPAWDNGKLSVFPNIYGEAQIKDKSFLVQAGFVGRFIKNSYRNLSAINPYLATVSVQQNTKETELYGGIKASVGKHFNFSAKAGFISYNNLPFYINDTATDNKSFLVSNESKVTDLRIHADMSFISQDKFTITGGLTFNGYTGMKDNDKAWGTIPLEITASMRWWAFKQVMLKSDFRAFTGGPYLLKSNVNKTLSGAADLSAGLEFAINKNFSAWVDVNNIFNNKYERWHNYQVYGLNVLGGVIYKF